MSQRPTPSIVSQEAAAKMPRLALFLCCFIYLIPGFIGRSPWRGADLISLATMNAMANGHSPWLSPGVLGRHVSDLALLPYWLGAFSIKIFSFLPSVAATRVPFIFLLALTMTCTWYACYYLALSPRALPVPFAFGGEASPKSYARAMADGGLLAFIACMGLAQLSHETTPALTQLSMGSLMFMGAAVLSYRPTIGCLSFTIGTIGLTLSGAANMAWLFCAGTILITAIDHSLELDKPKWSAIKLGSTITILICVALGCLGLAYALHIWDLHWILPTFTKRDWRGFGELFLWFLWPAWPLALWTLWRWRNQLFTIPINRHIALPLWFCLIAIFATFASHPSDRALLIGLPAIACLAAFSLPTLSRSMAALIDWFTLIFFTGCAITIWVIWLSMETGFPHQPAMNVARLVPGFVSTMSWRLILPAFLATVAWAWLVYWRVSKNRKVLWRSLVLPAGGTTLCWLLLMTLWLPLLNYSQGYSSTIQRINKYTNGSNCVEVTGLGNERLAALSYYSKTPVQISGLKPACQWLITEPINLQPMTMPLQINFQQWQFKKLLAHPESLGKSMLLLERKSL
jgi:hypothetical protein